MSILKMNTDEYLKDRLDDQISWYDRKSSANQKYYKRLRIAEFVLAALIPFLAGFVTFHGSVQLLIGLAGVCIAVITALHGLYQYEKLWIEYRTTCESLKKERYLFLTETTPYSSSIEENLKLLVQRVEMLVSKENTNWSQFMVQPAEDSKRAVKN